MGELETSIKDKIEALDKNYPVSEIWEGLDSPYTNLYVNLPIQRDPLKQPAFDITGSTGAGKDTLRDGLVNLVESYIVTTATNRKHRIGEEPENAYVWMRPKNPLESDDDYFKSLIAEYNLLESSKHYGGRVYGLPRESLLSPEEGLPLIRNDINGAVELNETMPKEGFQLFSVAVFPDSWAQAHAVLLERGDISTQEALERIEEDIRNLPKIKSNVNFILHNTRNFIAGLSGLDISLGALQYVVGEYLG